MQTNRDPDDEIHLGLKLRLTLFVYRYLLGPLTDAIVAMFQFVFVCFDKITGHDPEPLDPATELRVARRDNRLDATAVPDDLRSLVPLARKWGLGDDAIRGQAVDAVTAAERRALIEALAGKVGAADAWIASFAEGEMPDEAAAFMYLLEAVEEMGLEVR